MKNTKQQLEISLPLPSCSPRRRVQRVRSARAQWWFERMRRVVDAAPDPAPAPTPIAAPVPVSLESERQAA